MSSFENNIATATEEDKLQAEEKMKWEEENPKIKNTFTLPGQQILLNVGGIRFSTSRSTLTKYPESMLGVMFSGRHDLETMKCSDGSFFIDRDGTHFRYILNYLRDGEERVWSFPKSLELLQEIFCEAKYYQLSGLLIALNSLMREVDVVSQDSIALHFVAGSGRYNSENSGGSFNVKYHSKQAISYKLKNMKGLSFNSMRFSYPLSFSDCDLSNASFTNCFFESDVIFEDCILDGTTFSMLYGLVATLHNVSFTGSKTDNTNFDGKLRAELRLARKII
ncbi:uncharacterized protein [Dysidea avara]|uniref:uncharacterized protein n=1 Tax=Dysidea avara TaxID=196820 RepID=UPI00331999AC